jgi:hypothetical protein
MCVSWQSAFLFNSPGDKKLRYKKFRAHGHFVEKSPITALETEPAAAS